MKESRRDFLKYAGGVAAFAILKNGLAVPAAYASHGERPQGCPEVANVAVPTQVAEIANSSNFVREGGNGWRTIGELATINTPTFTPENSRPYVLGNSGEKGSIDTTATVKSGSLVYVTGGTYLVELARCGIVIAANADSSNTQETKTFLRIPGCAEACTEQVRVMADKGNNRFFAYEMAGVDPEGKVNRGQLGQLLDTASKLKTPITDLSFVFVDSESREWLKLGANPTAGNVINFADGNAPRA